MTCLSLLIFGLIVLSNVDIVYSDTGICYKCKDYLNQVQCNASFASCNWNSNNVCVSVASSASASVKVAQTSVSANTYSCSYYTSQQNCLGFDGSSYTKRCVYDNNLCHAVDSTQACTAFTTQNQCNINSVCKWTPTNPTSQASTAGLCALHQCGDYNNNLQCLVVVTSPFSAQPCKWVFYSNATSTTSYSNKGNCVAGQASDISKTNCETVLGLYFTYSDAQNVCTACTESPPSGANLLSMGFVFAALLVLLNW